MASQRPIWTVDDALAIAKALMVITTMKAEISDYIADRSPETHYGEHREMLEIIELLETCEDALQALFDQCGQTLAVVKSEKSDGSTSANSSGS